MIARLIAILAAVSCTPAPAPSAPARCGETETRAASPSPAPPPPAPAAADPSPDGPPQAPPLEPDPEAVARYNEWIRASGYGQDARKIVLAGVPPVEEPVDTSFEIQFGSRENPSEATAVWTEDGYLDDSLRGTRKIVELVRQDGVWQIRSVVVEYRCWPGRGHEIFARRPCV